MGAKSRIGLYGGTFDPVHLGHVAIAQNVCELFEIDRVIFVPAQIAPHKLESRVTPSLHRYAMLVLATQHDPRLFVSAYELESEYTSYTVDTLSYFKGILGPACDLFFIMGADSWADITSWRDWKRLLAVANHIVVTRPGYEIEAQSDELRGRLIDLRNLNRLDDELLESGTGRVFVTDAVMNEVSATEVRLAVNEGRLGELKQLVPEPVAEYIGKYGIYGRSNGPEFNSKREVFESAD